MPLQQGMNQQTPAVIHLIRTAVGRVARSGTKRRRKGSKKKHVARRARGKSTRRTKRPARLVKGSAAAKRYMASIRRKRRK
jgi:hypothetical protein